MILKFVLVMAMCASGCTVTIAPIEPTPRSKPKLHRTVHKSKPKKSVDSANIVDHGWLVEYKRLEELHGDYTIKDDYKVESVGGGKYRVTPAMLSHFKDLNQVPVP